MDDDLGAFLILLEPWWLRFYGGFFFFKYMELCKIVALIKYLLGMFLLESRIRVSLFLGRVALLPSSRLAAL